MRKFKLNKFLGRTILSVLGVVCVTASLQLNVKADATGYASGSTLKKNYAYQSNIRTDWDEANYSIDESTTQIPREQMDALRSSPTWTGKYLGTIKKADGTLEFLETRPTHGEFGFAIKAVRIDADIAGVLNYREAYEYYVDKFYTESNGIMSGDYVYFLTNDNPDLCYAPTAAREPGFYTNDPVIGGTSPELLINKVTTTRLIDSNVSIIRDGAVVNIDVNPDDPNDSRSINEAVWLGFNNLLADPGYIINIRLGENGQGQDGYHLYSTAASAAGINDSLEPHEFWMKANSSEDNSLTQYNYWSNISEGSNTYPFAVQYAERNPKDFMSGYLITQFVSDEVSGQSWVHDYFTTLALEYLSEVYPSVYGPYQEDYSTRLNTNYSDYYYFIEVQPLIGFTENIVLSAGSAPITRSYYGTPTEIYNYVFGGNTDLFGQHYTGMYSLFRKVADSIRGVEVRDEFKKKLLDYALLPSISFIQGTDDNGSSSLLIVNPDLPNWNTDLTVGIGTNAVNYILIRNMKDNLADVNYISHELEDAWTNNRVSEFSDHLYPYPSDNEFINFNNLFKHNILNTGYNSGNPTSYLQTWLVGKSQYQQNNPILAQEEGSILSSSNKFNEFDVIYAPYINANEGWHKELVVDLTCYEEFRRHFNSIFSSAYSCFLAKDGTRNFSGTVLSLPSNNIPIGEQGILFDINGSKEYKTQIAGSTVGTTWPVFGQTVYAKSTKVSSSLRREIENFNNSTSDNWPYLLVYSLTPVSITEHAKVWIDATNVPYVNDPSGLVNFYGRDGISNSPVYDEWFSNNAGQLVSEANGSSFTATGYDGRIIHSCSNVTETYEPNAGVFNSHGIGFRISKQSALDFVNGEKVAFHYKVKVDDTEQGRNLGGVDIGFKMNIKLFVDSNGDGSFETNVFDYCGDFSNSAIRGLLTWEVDTIDKMEAYGKVYANTPISKYSPNAGSSVFTEPATWDVANGIPTTESLCIVTGGSLYEAGLSGVIKTKGSKFSLVELGLDATTRAYNKGDGQPVYPMSDTGVPLMGLQRKITIKTNIVNIWGTHNTPCTLSCPGHPVFSKTGQSSPAIPTNVMSGSGTQSPEPWSCSTCGATGSYTYTPGTDAISDNPATDENESADATNGSWSGGHSCSWSATFDCSTGSLNTNCVVENPNIKNYTETDNKQSYEFISATFKCGTKSYGQGSTVTEPNNLLDEGYTSGTGCQCSGDLGTNFNMFHPDSYYKDYTIYETVDYLEAKQLSNWLVLGLGYNINSSKDLLAGYSGNDIMFFDYTSLGREGSGNCVDVGLWRTFDNIDANTYGGRVWFTTFSPTRDEVLRTQGIDVYYSGDFLTWEGSKHGRYYLGNATIELWADANASMFDPDYGGNISITSESLRTPGTDGNYTGWRNIDIDPGYYGATGSTISNADTSERNQTAPGSGPEYQKLAEECSTAYNRPGDSMDTNERICQSLLMVNHWQKAHDTEHYVFTLSDMVWCNTKIATKCDGVYYETADITQDIFAQMWQHPDGVKLFSSDFIYTDDGFIDVHYRTHLTNVSSTNKTSMSDNYIEMSDLNYDGVYTPGYASDGELGVLSIGLSPSSSTTILSDDDSNKLYYENFTIGNSASKYLLKYEDHNNLNYFSNPKEIGATTEFLVQSATFDYPNNQLHTETKRVGCGRNNLYANGPLDRLTEGAGDEGFGNFNAGDYDPFEAESDTIVAVGDADPSTRNSIGTITCELGPTQNYSTWLDYRDPNAETGDSGVTIDMIKDLTETAVKNQGIRYNEGYWTTYFYPGVVGNIGTSFTSSVNLNNVIDFQAGGGVNSANHPIANLKLYGTPMVISDIDIKDGVPNGVYGGMFHVFNTYAPMAWSVGVEQGEFSEMLNKMGYEMPKFAAYTESIPTIQVMCSYIAPDQSDYLQNNSVYGDKALVREDCWDTVSEPPSGWNEEEETLMEYAVRTNSLSSIDVMLDRREFGLWCYSDDVSNFNGTGMGTYSLANLKDVMRPPINDVVIHNPIAVGECKVLSNETGKILNMACTEDETGQDMRVDSQKSDKYIVSGNKFYIWYSDVGDFDSAIPAVTSCNNTAKLEIGQHASVRLKYTKKNALLYDGSPSADSVKAINGIDRTSVLSNHPLVTGYRGVINTGRWVQSRYVKFPFAVSCKIKQTDGSYLTKVFPAYEYIDLSTLSAIGISVNATTGSSVEGSNNVVIKGDPYWENSGSTRLTLGDTVINGWEAIWKPNMSRIIRASNPGASTSGKVVVSDTQYEELADLDFGSLYEFTCLTSAIEQDPAKVEFYSVAINAPELDTDRLYLQSNVGKANDTSDDWFEENQVANYESWYNTGTNSYATTTNPLINALNGLNSDSYKNPVTIKTPESVSTSVNITRMAGSFKAPVSAKNEYSIDVIGRIGNLSVVDTGDFRYSTLFKYTYTTKDWLISQVIYKTEPTSSKNVGLPFMDLMLNPINTHGASTFSLTAYHISNVNNWNANPSLNRIDLEGNPFTVFGKTAIGNSNYFSLPLTPKNVVEDEFKSEPVRLGYKVFLDIETLGNYHGTNSSDFVGNELSSGVKVIPHYMLYDYKTGDTITDIEIWYGSEGSRMICYDANDMADGTRSIVNESLMSKIDETAIYTSEEDLLRYPFSKCEKLTTVEAVSYIRSISQEGTVGTLTQAINTSGGLNVLIGNPSRIFLTEKTKSYSGSPLMYSRIISDVALTQDDFDSASDIYTSIELPGNPKRFNQLSGRDNSDDYIREPDINPKLTNVYDFVIQGQRWYFSLQLPSSAYISSGVEFNSTNQMDIEASHNALMRDHPNAVILCYLEITASDSPWTLEYDAELINNKQPVEYSIFDLTVANKPDLFSSGNAYKNTVTIQSGNNPVINPKWQPVCVFTAYNNAADDLDAYGTH